MPTIEITDEQYEFLKEAQNLLKTQDNRCTRDPLYCIMKKERVYGLDSDYASDFIWFRDDCQFETSQDLFDDIMDRFADEIKQYTKEYYGVEGPIDENDLEKGFLEDVEDTQYALMYDDFLSEHDYNRVYYTTTNSIDEQSNIWSFFEVEAEEYIDNKYAKDSRMAFSYACSSWRSTKMNKIRDFLKEVKL